MFSRVAWVFWYEAKTLSETQPGPSSRKWPRAHADHLLDCPKSSSFGVQEPVFIPGWCLRSARTGIVLSILGCLYLSSQQWRGTASALVPGRFPEGRCVCPSAAVSGMARVLVFHWTLPTCHVTFKGLCRRGASRKRND